MDIDQLLHLVGKVTRCASGGDVDLTPTPQRLHEEEQIRRPFTTIFIVVASGLSRSGRQRLRTSLTHGIFVIPSEALTR